jgi:hypothetical protein
VSRRLANRLRRLREWLTERSIYTLEGETVAEACAALEAGRVLPWSALHRAPRAIGELRQVARDYPVRESLVKRRIGEGGLSRVLSVVNDLRAYQTARASGK